MKWISTKERLPEEYGEILFVGDGVTKHGEYSSYRGEFGSWESGYHRVEEVEWWMPLPPPPSEEEIPWEEVRKEKEFKVGMKVRVVKNLFKGEWKCRDEDYPIGSLAKVNHISMHEYLEECRDYGVREAEFVSAGYCDFHPDELEIIE